MRLCTLIDGGHPRAGLVTGDEVTPLEASGPLEIVLGAAVTPAGDALPIDPARLGSPLRPGKLIGIGLNYRDHAAETGAKVPTEPLLFAKLASAVAPPSGPVVIPAYTDELDYEGELAVVIGRAARDVPEARALEHVFGYAVMNDVSARDRQRAEPQWVRAKGGDTFAPWGPWITTADEVPDPQALGVRTWVSGELMQDGTTADMVFGVAELVAYCSRQFTLEPGDVITTGTPAGVGMGRTPKRFLRPGDVVRVEVDRLGSIEHPVVAP
ncbi:MAG TPA: fumarylacetoacetate hydrolase family protein [Miltoncostaeaceae bacterium]|nr:fumarylacetoacetate hydrolase family protein [Miltoncostaeaceae bacterium]